MHPRVIARIPIGHAAWMRARMTVSLHAPADRLRLLRFASTFLWADLEIDLLEHDFFLSLAEELGFTRAELPSIVALLDQPPPPGDVDPTRVPVALARTVREVALRAIACDGRVQPGEMELFELLDELLPPARDAGPP